MRSVEEPGVSSTKVSFDDPKGAKTSHATAPAAITAKSKTQRANRKTAAAIEPLFLLPVVRLLRVIRLLSTLLLL
jgi:hypothetical protein